MRTITVLNQKGGVGKTSTCHHLSGVLAETGRRVLLVDNDPQSSLSQGFFGPVATRAFDPSETIAAIYRGDRPYPDQVIRPTGLAGVDIVPGSRAASLHNVPAPYDRDDDEQRCLRSFLEEVGDESYDVCLIDCPPNLHLCSWSALVASDYLVVPLQPEDYGAQGIMDVQESVDLVQAGPNPSLKLLGFLLTMVVARKSVHQIFERNIRTLYGEDVFASVVPESAPYAEAIMERKTISQYKPKGSPAKSIRAVAEELLARIGSVESVATPLEVVS
jgi:chromosome partitioning protein